MTLRSCGSVDTPSCPWRGEVKELKMVSIYDLLPGDVLMDGSLIIRSAKRDGTEEEKKTIVLRPDGLVEWPPYSHHFNIFRGARPWEE
jgi:hypothetical protein